MIPAREIVHALGVRRSGKGWLAKCPAHKDKHPSLSIDEGSDGKALVKCRAGCSQDDVIDALRGRGLWPEPHTTAPKAASTVAMRTAMPKAPDVEWTPVLPVPDGTPSPDFKGLLGAEPSAFWDYQDSRGRPLGYVARLDRADGKAMLPVTWCCAGETTAWRVKAFPAPRPLYGLPQLAERPDAPVLVVEGEKVVVAAAQLFDDRVAVTWHGGSGAVGKADWRRLKGRDIVIWPDADAPGKKAALEVAEQALCAGATSARIVALPDGLPDGWDLADTAPDGVAQGQHGTAVGDPVEGPRRRRPDRVGRAVGAYEIGKPRLDGVVAPAQGVIVAIADFGVVVVVIETVVTGDLGRQPRQQRRNNDEDDAHDGGHQEPVAPAAGCARWAG